MDKKYPTSATAGSRPLRRAVAVPARARLLPSATGYRNRLSRRNNQTLQMRITLTCFGSTRRRVFGGCLWPNRGHISFIAAALGSQMNGRRLRPVNACRQACRRCGRGAEDGIIGEVPSASQALAKEGRERIWPARGIGASGLAGRGNRGSGSGEGRVGDMEGRKRKAGASSPRPVRPQDNLDPGRQDTLPGGSVAGVFRDG